MHSLVDKGCRFKMYNIIESICSHQRTARDTMCDIRTVLASDGHVREENRGDEEVLGRHGVKERNVEGQTVVEFAKWMETAVVNTYFQNREEHMVT